MYSENAVVNLGQKVFIKGLGRLGLSLAMRSQQLGMAVCALYRSQDERQRALVYLSEKTLLAEHDAAPSAEDIVFLTVPDRHLEQAAREALGYSEARYTVVHCSGAAGPAALAPVPPERAVAAHPYQTFPVPSPDSFERAPWLVESGNHQAAERVRLFIGLLGSIPVTAPPMDEKTRALYHASAVVASNTLTGLVHTARELCLAAGVSPAEFLPAIMHTSLTNALAAVEQPSLPLSGPVIRADIPTIKRHISCLYDNPILLRQYILLSEVLLSAAARMGMVDKSFAERLAEVFHANS